MGQSPVCSFCSDQEREQNLNSQNNFLISDNKNITLMEHLILKENKKTYAFNWKYIGGYTTSSLEGFNILRWPNDCEFKGYFQYGSPTGWGIYKHPENGTFKGEYEMINLMDTEYISI